MEWRNRSVLVTGATGLVGSHLCRVLAGLGATVTVLVRDSTRMNPSWADSVVWGDVRDLDLMRRVLAEYEVRTVFHLAAQTIVGVANRDPLSTWESNVRGTYSLMEAVRAQPNAIDVVVASTDKAYGSHPQLPTSETCPLEPDYPYDVSKACADMICASYAKTFGCNVAVTRCGNLFGEGDLNWNRLVPGAIRSILQGERPVVRSDGTLVRDYLYVGNAVDAYVRVAEFLAKPWAAAHPRPRAFNISDSSPMSVLQMIDRIGVACGMRAGEVSPVVLCEPCLEIPEQYLDSDRIRRETGWEAAVPLDDALRRTVDWYRSSFFSTTGGTEES